MVQVLLVFCTYGSIDAMTLLLTRLKTHSISEEGSSDSTYLSDSITPLFLVHELPVEFTEGLDGFGDLNDYVKCIVRQVI